MKASPKPKREWITISAASVSRLVVYLLILATVLVGYRLWRQSDLQRQAVSILRDAEALAEQLEVPDTALDMLRDARVAHDRGEWESSVQRGKRFIAFVNSFHEPSGGVKVLQVEGGVESRRGDSESWRRVPNGARLRFGTWVKTDASGSAELVFPGGTILQLRPESMMQIDHRAALHAGGFDVTTNKRDQTVTVPGIATRLGADSEANFSIDGGGGATVAVIGGGAEVTTEEGESRRLGPLQRVVKIGERLSDVEAVLAEPQLTEPDDWRVVDPAKVSEIVLVWQPVDGARVYRLQVSAGPLFATNLIDDERSATRARLGANDEGSFHWRVAAVDKKGMAGSWSKIRRFQVRTLTAEADRPAPEPPKLELDELLHSGRMVIVTGATDPQAVVTVQGRRLYVPPSGRFRTSIELKSEGKHTLRIVATNESGGQAVETREVIFDPVY